MDFATTQLLSAQTNWHAPSELTVNTATRIALTIGQSSQIDATIRSNLPKAKTTPVGTVQVGPDVVVTLQADSEQAAITPTGQISNSTTRQVALYYQWTVRALHPTKALQLTAHIVVPLTGTSHQITHDVDLSVPVKATWSYRAYQLFTNWKTWSAIVVGLGAVAGWIWKRRPFPHRPKQV